MAAVAVNSSRLIDAGRHAGCLSQQDLVSEVGIVTVRQIEAGLTEARRATLPVVQAFERAGIDFLDENGGGPGVRLRKRQRPKRS
jgi:hypothetical protein